MVSVITTAELLDYVREDNPDETAVNQIELMRKAAIGYMTSYTGQTAEYLDEHEEFDAVLMVLVADMYDNRSLTVDSDRQNPFVMSVIDMHWGNLF